jgi:hypothetical protein
VLSKTVTYENLDGEMVTKEWHFNFTKAELAQMKLAKDEGLEVYLKRIVDAKDGSALVDTFSDILSKAVGRREGDQFIKNDQIRAEFMNTNAFSEVFMEIMTNENAAVEFIKGCVPSDISKKVDLDKVRAEVLGQSAANVELPSENATIDGVIVPKQRDISSYTKAELEVMPLDEFEKLVSFDVGNLSKDILVLAMQRRNAGK